MKLILSALVALLLSFTTAGSFINEFEGTYEGLTDEMEFQFSDEEGKLHYFQEIDEGISYDLYDEEIVGEKFKVSWEERDAEVIDEENEEVTIEKVKVITQLEKL